MFSSTRTSTSSAPTDPQTQRRAFSGGRTRRIASWTALSVLAILTSLGWSNWRYIDAYLENDIGPPDHSQTTPVTAALNQPALHLAVVGDVGTGGQAEYRTAAVIDKLEQQSEFDALLLLGDNVYDNGDPSQLEATVFDPFAPVLDGGTNLIAVLGNHDVDGGFGDAQAAALGMPGRWYTTQTEPATIVALDSTQADNETQLAWLRTTLANTTTQWTIVIMHHPAYSAGWHGGDPAVQANFVPLFEEYGVDLVLSGHDHDYQRSKKINGVTYVVTGAGAKLRATGHDEFTAISWSTHNFVDLAIHQDRIDAQAVDHNERAIDTFTLRDS